MQRRCVVVNGQLTAFLRARWGLPKNRQESDRHHALDAAVVAACSHAMVRAWPITRKTRELEYLREGFPDPATGEIHNPAAHQKLAERFPEPWPHFRHELEMRLKTDDLERIARRGGAAGHLFR
jgi:CRISPR-associated endonuclease Csn1